MSLPEAWIDRIFSKMTVTYGAAWMRMWEGVEASAVKREWAETLSGFHGDALAYGLRYLPSERPPNAMQFRDICRRAPEPNTPRLTGPVTPMPEAVREKLAKAKASITSVQR